jgi:hypothetical protein
MATWKKSRRGGRRGVQRGIDVGPVLRPDSLATDVAGVRRQEKYLKTPYEIFKGSIYNFNLGK